MSNPNKIYMVIGKDYLNKDFYVLKYAYKTTNREGQIIWKTSIINTKFSSYKIALLVGKQFAKVNKTRLLDGIKNNMLYKRKHMKEVTYENEL